MFPIRDNIPSQTFPYVNYGIIVTCVLVFLTQLSDTRRNGTLTERLAMVPSRLTHPNRPVVIREKGRVGRLEFERVRELARPNFPVWITVLTCIFLHGNWLHLIGNMWFLFIFGDNVEDRLGHARYFIFYCVCGALASLAHWYMYPESSIPTVGASGAIAGVMGAYFVLYPKAMVLTAVPIFFYLTFLVLPAWFFLGFWFVFQFAQATDTSSSINAGGVAWWAHVGGFVAGSAGGLVLRITGWGRKKVVRYRPGTERIGWWRAE